MAITRKPPTLVVLQLTGGNDVLNTLVPYGNPLYYDQRPTVRIPEDQVLPIDDCYGFHPSMAAIKPFWDQGKMAVINGKKMLSTVNSNNSQRSFRRQQTTNKIKSVTRIRAS